MSNINYNIIQQYLDGELDTDTMNNVEEQIKNDPEFAAEVNLYKNIEKDFVQHFADTKKDEKLFITISNLQNKHFNKELKKGKIKKIWLCVAAAASVAIVFFILKPSQKKVFDGNELFAYYAKDINSISTSTRGAEQDTAVIKAVSLYNSKDYEHALPALQKLIIAQPNQNELVLATAICFTQTGKYDSAIVLITPLISRTTVYKNQAIWYKSLTLLKQNNIISCYQTLKTISYEADEFVKAKQLMNDIEKSGTIKK